MLTDVSNRNGERRLVVTLLRRDLPTLGHWREERTKVLMKDRKSTILKFLCCLAVTEFFKRQQWEKFCFKKCFIGND